MNPLVNAYLDILYQTDKVGFELLMKRKEDLLLAGKSDNEAIRQAMYEYSTNQLDGS